MVLTYCEKTSNNAHKMFGLKPPALCGNTTLGLIIPHGLGQLVKNEQNGT